MYSRLLSLHRLLLRTAEIYILCFMGYHCSLHWLLPHTRLSSPPRPFPSPPHPTPSPPHPTPSPPHSTPLPFWLMHTLYMWAFPIFWLLLFCLLINIFNHLKCTKHKVYKITTKLWRQLSFSGPPIKWQTPTGLSRSVGNPGKVKLQA